MKTEGKEGEKKKQNNTKRKYVSVYCFPFFFFTKLFFFSIGISKRKTRFHIDMFLDIEKLWIDRDLVWENNDFLRFSKEW